MVKALTDNDRIEARRVISSGFISVGVLSAVFLIGGLVFLYIINLNRFFISTCLYRYSNIILSY